MKTTINPIRQPNVAGGYYCLSWLAQLLKKSNKLCQQCRFVYYDCTLAPQAELCSSYRKYSNHDRYHPKSRLHKFGLRLLVPTFGIACVGIIVTGLRKDQDTLTLFALIGIVTLAILLLLVHVGDDRKEKEYEQEG